MTVAVTAAAVAARTIATIGTETVLARLPRNSAHSAAAARLTTIAAVRAAALGRRR